MASCSTKQWSTKYTPQARLTVVQSSSTATTATYTWTLEYVTYGYAASVRKVRDWSVTFDGAVIKSGTFDINGVKNTTTIATDTITKTKGTSSRKITFGVSFVFNLTWTDVYGGTMTASETIDLAAKTSYTVSYNANGNGATGAPGVQTKWHGTNITLSSAKPTRTGYTFLGWATSSTATTATYLAGGTYSANASVTLYAVWKINTFDMKFDANGGTGGPGTMTKTYGTTFYLPPTVPTRTNYKFLGWGTSASATVVTYPSGSAYTTNSEMTFYAIWELAYVRPRIDNASVERYDATTGTASDTGTSASIKFDWATDQEVTQIKIEWESATQGSGSEIVEASGTSGHVDTVVGNGTLSAESTYIIRIFVWDCAEFCKDHYTKIASTLNGQTFPIDVLAEGAGVAIGKPAELRDMFDVKWKTMPRGGFVNIQLETDTDLNDVRTPNTYIGANMDSNNYLNCPLKSGTFTLVVESAGEEGQIKQILTRCSKYEPEKYIRFYYQDSWSEWMPEGGCVIYVRDAGTDLNDYKETGTYYFNTSYIPLNIPAGCVNGWLVVLRADGGALKQLWFRYGTFGTNDSNTYVRTGNASGWGPWKKYAVEPDVLFEGSSNGDISLSESVENFKYIEIFFTDNNSVAGGYTKIYSPSNKKADLFIIEAGADGNTYIRRTRYVFSGASLMRFSSSNNNGYAKLSGTALSHIGVGTNYIYITRVLGHRS